MHYIRELFTWRKPKYDPVMPTEPVEGRMYTVPEAAEAMGISRQRLHRLIQQGRVVAYKFGRVLMVPESAVGNIEPSPNPVGRPRKHKRRE